MPAERKLRVFVCMLAAVLGWPVATPRAADPGATAPPILVSRQLLDAHGLTVGETVQLASDRSAGDARPFRIVGVYEPTPDPMRITASRFEARLHLPDLLDLTADPEDPAATESVQAINVTLHDAGDARPFADDVSARLVGLVGVPTTLEERAEALVVLERFHQAIAIVTVAASTAFLLALMVMRAEERRETVGILRLIGLTKHRVLVEVFVEGLVVALVGALFGAVLAALSQDLFNRFFQWYYDTNLVFVRVSVGLAARCVAIAVPLGALAGVLSSWTLLRREVMGLLRR